MSSGRGLRIEIVDGACPESLTKHMGRLSKSLELESQRNSKANQHSQMKQKLTKMQSLKGNAASKHPSHIPRLSSRVSPVPGTLLIQSGKSFGKDDFASPPPLCRILSDEKSENVRCPVPATLRTPVSCEFNAKRYRQLQLQWAASRTDSLPKDQMSTKKIQCLQKLPGLSASPKAKQALSGLAQKLDQLPNPIKLNERKLLTMPSPAVGLKAGKPRLSNMEEQEVSFKIPQVALYAYLLFLVMGMALFMSKSPSEEGVRGWLCIKATTRKMTGWALRLPEDPNLLSFVTKIQDFAHASCVLGYHLLNSACGTLCERIDNRWECGQATYGCGDNILSRSWALPAALWTRHKLGSEFNENDAHGEVSGNVSFRLERWKDNFTAEDLAVHSHSKKDGIHPAGMGEKMSSLISPENTSQKSCQDDLQMTLLPFDLTFQAELDPHSRWRDSATSVSVVNTEVIRANDEKFSNSSPGLFRKIPGHFKETTQRWPIARGVQQKVEIQRILEGATWASLISS